MTFQPGSRFLTVSLIFWINVIAKLHASQQDDGLQFLVMADWGGLPTIPYKTPIEAAVSNEMAKFADTHPIEFILALGDNFYFDGVTNIDDARFQETYEDVYTADSLHVPWYLVAGNHDYLGNISAQIGYSKLSKRWNFPDYYYSITKEVPGTKMIVEFILLDTILLCGNSGYDLEYQQPQGPENPLHAAQQWRWLEEKIKNSRADYLIVGGHYPVYSVAEHGPTKILIKNLDPLLHKYNVTAYFSGHDHNLQHLQYTDSVYRSTMDYFISGSGNFIDPSLRHKHDVPDGSSKFHWANVLALGGFGYVQATSQNMTFTFVEANGKHLYQHTLYPRKLK